MDGFIRVVKQTDMMHNVSVRAIDGPAHLVRENATSDRNDCIWLVNYQVDFDTNWTVNCVTMPESRCAGKRFLIELYCLT